GSSCTARSARSRRACARRSACCCASSCTAAWRWRRTGWRGWRRGRCWPTRAIRVPRSGRRPPTICLQRCALTTLSMPARTHRPSSCCSPRPSGLTTAPPPATPAPASMRCSSRTSAAP
ncbi:hypothetical protein H4R19_006737, partial [Coemansia spiralis]